MEGIASRVPSQSVEIELGHQDSNLDRRGTDPSEEVWIERTSTGSGISYLRIDLRTLRIVTFD